MKESKKVIDMEFYSFSSVLLVGISTGTNSEEVQNSNLNGK